MIVGIVDCETTGLGKNDEIITLAVIYGEVDDKGKFSSFIEWYGERFPNVSISPGAYKIHGRTKDSLKDKSINIEELKGVIDSIDVLIAHNCMFDSRMLQKLIPEVRNKEWRCSCKQWPWPNMDNRKLDTMCAYYGINRPQTHGALEDAKALMDGLLKPSGKTERSMTYLKKLMSKKSFDVLDGYRQIPSGDTKTITLTLNLSDVMERDDRNNYSNMLMDHERAYNFAKDFGKK